MSDLRIGDLSVAPGEFATGNLHLFRLASGRDVAVPIQVWHGARPGPVLCLVANQHGNEFRPISVFRELVRNLKPADMRGSVIGLPIANPFSFEMCSRNTWLDGLNGNDGNLNRVWPGNPIGWTTSQIAAKITETILGLPDVVIDFHNGTHTLSIYYSYITSVSGPLGDEITRLSQAFGLEILIKRAAITGSLTESLVDRGIPAWAVELGEFYGFPDDQGFTPRLYPEVGYTGVMNVMSEMGMIDHPIILPRRRVTVESALIGIAPTTGGVLASEVGVRDIGRVVPGGFVLGRVLHPVTFEDELVLTAPLAENLIIAVTETRPLTPVNPGAGDWGYYVTDYATATWDEPATTSLTPG